MLLKQLIRKKYLFTWIYDTQLIRQYISQEKKSEISLDFLLGHG